jgi:hypothetical protein
MLFSTIMFCVFGWVVVQNYVFLLGIPSNVTYESTLAAFLLSSFTASPVVLAYFYFDMNSFIEGEQDDAFYSLYSVKRSEIMMVSDNQSLLNDASIQLIGSAVDDELQLANASQIVNIKQIDSCSLIYYWITHNLKNAFLGMSIFQIFSFLPTFTAEAIFGQLFHLQSSTVHTVSFFLNIVFVLITYVCFKKGCCHWCLSRIQEQEQEEEYGYNQSQSPPDLQLHSRNNRRSHHHHR